MLENGEILIKGQNGQNIELVLVKYFYGLILGPCTRAGDQKQNFLSALRAIGANFASAEFRHFVFLYFHFFFVNDFDK